MQKQTQQSGKKETSKKSKNFQNQRKPVTVKRNNRSQKSNRSKIDGSVSYIEGYKQDGKLLSGSPRNEVRIKKTEFLFEIQPSEQWKVTKLAVNPGLTSTFPWLAGVARNFEKYRIHKFTLMYKTGQSSIVPGKVQFCPDFDPSDPAPITKREALTYTLATDGPVWQNFSLDIPVGYMMNQDKYYIRQETSIIDNIKFYDPMNVWVGNDAVSTDLAYLGEVWLSYDISLYEPQTPPIQDFTSLGIQFIFPTVTNGNPFGASEFITQGSLNVTVDQLNSMITFNQPWTGIIINQIQENENFQQIPFDNSELVIGMSPGCTYFGMVNCGGEIFNQNGYNCRLYALSYSVPMGGSLSWQNTGGYQADAAFTKLRVTLVTGGPLALSN